MAKKRALNKEQARELFDYIRSGHSYKDAGKKWGVTQQTAGRYYREVLHERSRKAQANGGVRIVAERGGDRLTFSVDEGYMAHACIGGVDDVLAIKAKNDTEATEQFHEWLESVAAERMEYASQYLTSVPVNEALEKKVKELEGQVARLRDRAFELGDEAAELKTQLAEREAQLKSQADELEALKSKSQVEVEGYGLPSVVYAIIAEKPCVKCFGYYVDMDTACAETERLNEVTAMLGMQDAFDVHEVVLREEKE